MWGTSFPSRILGDYYALPQEGEGRALLRTPGGGVELISNVCRHRQAVILKGRGSLQPGASAGGNIVCPLHRWTYSGGNGSPAGTLLGAPHFAAGPVPEPEQLPAAGVERAAVRTRPRQPRRRGRPGRHGPARRPRLHRHGARPGGDARVQLQLEDLHRGLPGGLPRRPLPSGPGQLRHLRRPALGVQGELFGADRGRRQPPGQGRQPGVRALAERAAAVPRGPAAQVRRDLADLLPAHHGGVVPARAHRLAPCTRSGRRRP